MTVEEEVRAAWEWFYFHNGNFYIFDNAHKIPGSELFAGSTDATLAFTRQIQQEVASLKREMAWLKRDRSFEPEAVSIFGRLQVLLTEKSRGLKGAQ